MGKATRLLTILLTDSALEPYFAKLKEHGHTIIVDDSLHSLSGYDCIYGPKCYRLTPEMIEGLPAKTLPELIKTARDKKYAK